MVSPDFRHHAVGHLVLPFFRWHDRASSELIAYCDSFIDDAVMAQLRALADGWRDTAGLADPRVHVREVPDIARHPETGKARRFIPL